MVGELSVIQMKRGDIKFDIKLLRRGGNQLGVLAIAAGLIAFFVEPETSGNELKLVGIGFLAYFGSIIRRQKTLTTDDVIA